MVSLLISKHGFKEEIFDKAIMSNELWGTL